MNTKFKTALNQIYADPSLIDKTERAMKEIMSGKRNRTRKIIPMRIMVATVVACFVLIIAGSGFGTFMVYKTPICYLSIDINPSIELGINAFGTVVSSKAFNEEGALILNDVITGGQSVEDSVKALILSAIEKGFVADDGSTVILLTAETKGQNSALANKIETNSERGLDLALNQKEKTAVMLMEHVALKLREQAKLYGISAGKFNLIKKLQILNADTVIENYSNSSVKEIIFQINENTENKNQPSTEGNDRTFESQQETLHEEETEKNMEQNMEQNKNGKSWNPNYSSTQTEPTQIETTEESIDEMTTNEETTTAEMLPSNETSEGTTQTEATEPPGQEGTTHGTSEGNGQENTTETPNTSGSPSTSGTPNTSGAPSTTGTGNGDGKNH